MKQLSTYSFEIGAIRPPSEGGSNSLLIRVTRNCPWSRCKFCYATFYNREKFQLRTVEDIKKDIQAAKAISDEIKEVSRQLGYAGQINNVVGSTIIRREPELSQSYSFITVFNWLSSGGRTVFLQDADSLIMRTPELIEVIWYLKETFPSIERITSYARAVTIYRKTLEELKEIRAAEPLLRIFNNPRAKDPEKHYPAHALNNLLKYFISQEEGMADQAVVEDPIFDYHWQILKAIAKLTRNLMDHDKLLSP